MLVGERRIQSTVDRYSPLFPFRTIALHLYVYGKPNVAIFNSSNFIFSFVLCIQLCVLYSTCIQHSTGYLTFNTIFNIQLSI